MEGGKFENSGNNSANSGLTGWESLETEGRRHDLMLKIKEKFSNGNFKKAVSIAMLGLMTAGVMAAGNTDKNTVAESAPVEASMPESRLEPEWKTPEPMPTPEPPQGPEQPGHESKVQYDVTNGTEDILGETPQASAPILAPMPTPTPEPTPESTPIPEPMPTPIPEP